MKFWSRVQIFLEWLRSLDNSFPLNEFSIFTKTPSIRCSLDDVKRSFSLTISNSILHCEQMNQCKLYIQYEVKLQLFYHCSPNELQQHSGTTTCLYSYYKLCFTIFSFILAISIYTEFITCIFLDTYPILIFLPYTSNTPQKLEYYQQNLHQLA